MTVAPVAVSEPAVVGTDVEVGGLATDGFRAAPQRHQQATVPEVLGLVGDLGGGAREGVNAERGRCQGAGLLLDHLGGVRGETWQERWAASGLERVGPAGFRQAVCAAAGLRARQVPGIRSVAP